MSFNLTSQLLISQSGVQRLSENGWTIIEWLPLFRAQVRTNCFCHIDKISPSQDRTRWRYRGISHGRCHERDCNSLHFLWTLNPEENEPEIVTLRFAQVTFGVASSPFLLNATIKHHMELYRDCNPHFVKRFMSSIYVDDVSLGSNDVDGVFELYLKSKMRLMEAGFKLRKFVTNSSEFLHWIKLCEQLLPVNSSNSATDYDDNREDDQSYAKSTLGGRSDVIQKEHRILRSSG